MFPRGRGGVSGGGGGGGGGVVQEGGEGRGREGVFFPYGFPSQVSPLVTPSKMVYCE